MSDYQGQILSEELTNLFKSEIYKKWSAPRIIHPIVPIAYSSPKLIASWYGPFAEFGITKNIPNNWLRLHGYPMRRKRR